MAVEATPSLSTPSDGETCRFCPINLERCEGPCVFADVLNTITVGMIGIDRTRGLVFFRNQVARELLGSGTDELEHISSILFPGFSEGCPAVVEGVPQVIRHADRFVGYTVYHLNRRYCWIYLMDVTERIRLASIAEAVNIADNIGYIFAGIRHELGNPLNSIKMTLHLLRRNLTRFPSEKTIDFLDRALGEVDRADYILKALRNFNMFERAEPRDVRLPAFFAKLLPMVRRDFAKRGITLVLEQEPQAEWGRVDPRALQQALLNLLTNAAEALDGREERRIRVRTYRINGRIALSLEDTGCGMTPQQVVNLFRPFHTTKPGGTGLGLVIVKKLMAMMNGTVEVASTEGVGTTVTVTVPTGTVANDATS